jgi:hypothetical protein
MPVEYRIRAKLKQMNTKPEPSIDTQTLELLARWRSEDATSDPKELKAAERELAEFQRAMNRNRIQAGAHPIYPQPWPAPSPESET